MVKSRLCLAKLFWIIPCIPSFFFMIMNIIFFFFFGSHYAKGPSDAEGAIIKTWIDRQIAYVGCLI